MSGLERSDRRARYHLGTIPLRSLTPAVFAATAGLLTLGLPSTAGAARQISTRTHPIVAWVANHAYVTQPGQTITPVDLTQRQPNTPVTTGSQPTGLAVSGGQLFVANQGDNSLSIVDAASATVSSSVHVGLEPRAVAVGWGRRGQRLALVTNFGAGSLTPVGVAKAQVGSAVPVGPQPVAVATAPGGTGQSSLALVANFSSGTLTAVDVGTMHARKALSVGTEPNAVAVARVGSGRTWMALVADFGNNTVVPVRISSMTAGAPISLPGPPTDVAVAPGGSTAWVTSGSWLVPVSLRTLRAGTPIPMKAITEAVSFSWSPRTTTAWVAEQNGWLVPVNLGTRKPGAGIRVGGRPSAVVVSEADP